MNMPTCVRLCQSSVLSRRKLASSTNNERQQETMLGPRLSHTKQC